MKKYLKYIAKSPLTDAEAIEWAKSRGAYTLYYVPDTKTAYIENKHNPAAWRDFDAWQIGYDDAMYDGFDMSSEMPCQCEKCLADYAAGQDAAFHEIFGKKRMIGAHSPCRVREARSAYRNG